MAEITLNDEFGRAISETIVKYKYIHNLEIGAWDGKGSTQCFIDGMNQIDSNDKLLQCIEINTERYNELLETVKNVNYVKAYNMSSINKDSFIPQSFNEIWDSPHNNHRFGRQEYSRELVESWYEQDKVRFNDKGFLNSDLRLPEYDAVLIDGCEFSGYSEFLLLKDTTKCFMLDDVFHAYKGADAYYNLINDPEWLLIAEGRDVRNGFAIFRKKENE